jgi:putative intracellular protease/amidase
VRVLLPLPDRDFDVTEVAVPWAILREAGHQVALATEKAGTVPAADPRLLTGVIFGRLGAAPEAVKRYEELVRAPEFGATAGWADLDPAGFDGLILPGGHAPGMRQYLGSSVLSEQVGRFWRLGRPVGVRGRPQARNQRRVSPRESPPSAHRCRAARGRGSGR